MTTEHTSSSKQNKTSNRKSSKPQPAQTPAAPVSQLGDAQLTAVIENPEQASAGDMLRLQRKVGNRAVQRLLAQRKVQAKLTVGAANDKYEDEADHVADKVMRSAEPTPPNLNQRDTKLEEEDDIQRLPLAGPISTVQRKPEEEEIQQKESAERASGAGFEANASIESRLATNRGQGSPLPNDTRSFMENRFGSDFGGVRVHTGAESVQLNRDLSAQAFTHGPDVYFGEGKYNPGTNSGKQLLAHELTHVVQQGGAVARKIETGTPFANRQTSPVTKVSRQIVQRNGGEGGPEGAVVAPVEPEVLDGPGITAKYGSNYALTPEVEKALTVATTANPEQYTLIKPIVQSFMPVKHQKSVTDVQGFFQKVKGKAVDLRDFIRAFVIKQYANVLLDLYSNPEKRRLYPTTKAREARRDKTYLPKAEETRDKYKPLLKKGISAPETRAFLEANRFDAAVPLNDQEKAAQIATGPRIDVRSTFIGGKILGMSIRAHLFIVYTSSEGKQFYYRGGPGDSGNTVADMGEYVPGTVDWDPSSPSKTLLSGDPAKAKADALAEATTAIDGLQVPYVAFTGVKTREGENCNSTVWTILDRAGVPKDKPFGFHPGWGHVLGKALNKGTGTVAERETEESDSVPGFPQVLKGGAEAQVQIYADRAGAEKLTTLPGGTEVDMVRDSRYKGETNFVKIRFGDKKIGFVNLDNVDGRAGKPYLISGDGSHMVGVTELNSMKATEDFLAGGDSVDLVGPMPAESKLVRIWYQAGGETRIGRVPSGELVEKPVYVDPLVKYAYIPNGRPSLNVPAGKRFTAYPDATATVATEYVCDADRQLRIVVSDDLKRLGRCKVDVMGTGRYFFARFEDLFDEAGRPSPTIGGSGGSPPEVRPPEPEGGPPVVENVVEQRPPTGVEARRPSVVSKQEAYDKAKRVFAEMEGFDLVVIMQGAMAAHELKLALQHKPGVAAELAELSNGHLTAEEITTWVRE